MNKLYFVSKEVSDFLYSDLASHNLNLVNLGCLLFQRNVSRYSNTECIFRIAQDGILNVLPYLTKRLVYTDSETLFKNLISKRINQFEIVADQETRASMEGMTPGCFILALKLASGHVEAITMHKFKDALSTMVAKENLFSLHLRYLNREERVVAKENWAAEQINKQK